MHFSGCPWPLNKHRATITDVAYTYNDLPGFWRIIPGSKYGVPQLHQQCEPR